MSELELSSSQPEPLLDGEMDTERQWLLPESEGRGMWLGVMGRLRGESGVCAREGGR